MVPLRYIASSSQLPFHSLNDDDRTRTGAQTNNVTGTSDITSYQTRLISRSFEENIFPGNARPYMHTNIYSAIPKKLPNRQARRGEDHSFPKWYKSYLVQLSVKHKTILRQSGLFSTFTSYLLGEAPNLEDFQVERQRVLYQVMSPWFGGEGGLSSLALIISNPTRKN